MTVPPSTRLQYPYWLELVSYWKNRLYILYTSQKLFVFVKKKQITQCLINPFGAGTDFRRQNLTYIYSDSDV